MKLRNLLFAVLAAGFAFVGCEKEVDLGPAKIEANVTSLSFAATDDSQTIQITATRDWMATYDVDWLAVSPEKGEAGDAAQTVTVSVTQNDGYDRSTLLEFNIGYVKVTIPVAQAGSKGEPDYGKGTKEKPYTVAGAIAYVEGLGADVNSPEKVYIQGKVSKIGEEYNTQYGNGTFYISEDGTESGKQFYAYRVLYLGNKKFTSKDTQIQVGDDVIIYGTVVNYKGKTPETVLNQAFLYELNGENRGGDEGGSGGGTSEPKGTGTQADPFNAAAANAALKAGSTTEGQTYYISGKIASIKEAYSAQYGNATFYISDNGTSGEETFYCYRVLYLNNKKWTDGDTQIKEGDEVVIAGEITLYNGTPETSANKAYLYSLKSSGGSGSGEEGGIKAVTNAEFLAAEVSTTQWYELTGKVSNIVSTEYGNFDLTDAAGTKVYVYGLTATKVEKNDKSFASLGIKEGDTITIITLRSEYKGSPQAGGTTPAYIKGGGGDTPGPGGDTGEVKTVTVAEFLAAPESDTQKYQLTGIIGGTINDTYGNFDLTDDSGTVYVYGLTATDLGYGAKNDKSYSSLGLKAGDKITIIGYRGSYTNPNSGEKKDELMYAYFVKKEASGGDTPGPGGDTGEVKTVTVAEFLAAAESDSQKYQLTGTIGGAINDTYGNFDLTDESGTVYVYGLTATELGYGTKNDQSYSSLGLKSGDKITLIGYRGSYTNKNTGEKKDEVVYAYFVKKEASGEDPDPGTNPGGETGEVKTVTVSEFLAAAESNTQKYQLTGTIGGTINDTYGNFDLTDESGTVYVYGLTATDLGYGAKNDKSYASLGLKAGDKITVIGYRGSYTNPNTGEKKDELMYAYFVEKVASGENPDPGTGTNPGGEPASMEGAITVKLNNQNSWIEVSDGTYGDGFIATDASGISMGMYKHDNNNAPKAPDDNSVCVYKGAVITLKAPGGRKLQAIRFKADGADNGKYCQPLTVLEGGSGVLAANTAEMTIGDWSGNADYVVFQAKDGQARLVEAYVVLDGEGGGEEPGGSEEPLPSITVDGEFTEWESVQGAEGEDGIRYMCAAMDDSKLYIYMEVLENKLDFSTEKKYSNYATLYLSNGEGETPTAWTRACNKTLQFWMLYKQQIALKQWSTEVEFKQQTEGGVVKIEFSIPRSYDACLSGDNVWIGLTFNEQYTDNDENWAGTTDLLGVAPAKGGDMLKVRK